ncbi:MAG: hypothetical protein F6K42_24100 [Leptolyngbya sp. SIO1D8]|nr:hypothetical protein [Leptolyngbya sp. SIO1D8]
MVLKAKQSRRDHAAKTEALEVAGKEDTTRLNAEIPLSLHSRIKIQSTKERRAMTEIVIDALNEYLSRNSNE